MIADLGYFALIIALGASIYAAFAAWYGNRIDESRFVESARNAVILVFPLISLAAGTIIISLLNNDFSLEYVWRVGSIGMPTYLKVTSLWGGQAGSLLFWNLLLAAFAAIVMARKWRVDREYMAYVIIVISMTQVFFWAFRRLLRIHLYDWMWFRSMAMA